VAPASSEAVVVRLPDDVDLHARPAADFVRAAMQFDAAILVAAGEREVDAKSLLSVLALGAKAGTELRLTASGADAGRALDALSERVASLSD
jgi:phosphotransferase system HPr (HPr) family protein